MTINYAQWGHRTQGISNAFTTFKIVTFSATLSSSGVTTIRTPPASKLVGFTSLIIQADKGATLMIRDSNASWSFNFPVALNTRRVFPPADIPWGVTSLAGAALEVGVFGGTTVLIQGMMGTVLLDP